MAEWALIALFGGAMLGIGIASLPPQNVSLSDTSESLIDISIVGAVSNPGVYQVPANATLREALALTSFLPDANPQKLKWESKVRQGQVIKVAKKRKKIKKFDSSIVEKSQV